MFWDAHRVGGEFGCAGEQLHQFGRIAEAESYIIGDAGAESGSRVGEAKLFGTLPHPTSCRIGLPSWGRIGFDGIESRCGGVPGSELP